ncbi:MAG TPA: RidA family protein [Vicinamibacterales bacterium]|nr:RidA family protein [Vicinamibacterales bacterium]
MSHIVFVPATAAADTGADVARQATLALARVDERLRAERSSLADAAAITVYLKRAADFAAMNDAYRQAFTATPPTRTTVVTEPLTAGALVEISAIAARTGADRRSVHPASWMASPNPYSYAIRTGDTLFLSGLIARNGTDNSVVNGDVAAQTRAVMENARALLEAAGLGFGHLVSARAFLPDLQDFAEFNRVYREYVGAHRPARATVGAALTGSAYKVEVTFVASAAPRQAIEIAPEPNPNLSTAVKAGASLYISGLLADAAAIQAGPAAETRDIVGKIHAIVSKAGLSKTDVRDLLVYVTDDEAGKAALAECRAAFGTSVAASPVRAGLALPGARVEIMSYAERG